MLDQGKLNVNGAHIQNSGLRERKRASNDGGAIRDADDVTDRSR